MSTSEFIPGAVAHAVGLSGYSSSALNERGSLVVSISANDPQNNNGLHVKDYWPINDPGIVTLSFHQLTRLSILGFQQMMVFRYRLEGSFHLIIQKQSLYQSLYLVCSRLAQLLSPGLMITKERVNKHIIFLQV